MTMIMVSPTFSSETPPLTLHITGDYPTNGQISVRVFHSLEDFFNSRPTVTIEHSATPAPMSVTLTNLPPGSYIIQVLHDKNADGKLNSNAFGLPIESSTFVAPTPSDEPIKPSKARFLYDGSVNRYDVRLDAPAFESRAWGAGVMTIFSSSPYRGGDTEIRVLPLVTFIGEKFYVTGPLAGYNLVKNPFLSANIFAKLELAPDAFDDDKFLDGMENRRDTVMSGIDVTLDVSDAWRLDANVSTDLLDRHNGQEAALSLSRTFSYDTFNLSPGAGLTWRSHQYNDYYYGVQEKEATPERPAYKAGSSVDWFLKLSTRYALYGDWSLLGVIRVEFLGNEVQDSPIIDEKSVTSAFIGLSYAF